MLLHLTDLSAEPLHQQISRQIRAQILAGDLAQDAPLPSIRAFAKEHKVSVITVQRAYDDLLREGLLVSRRGKGFFVAPLSTDQRADRALERLQGQIKALVDAALAEGLSPAQIRLAVDQALKNAT